MKQPLSPSTLPSSEPTAVTAAATANSGNRGSKKMSLPKAQELVAHYESKGLESSEAAMKVIDDLQAALYRVVYSSGKPRKDKVMAEAAKKLDAASTRLAILDMKLDSKPGYGETLAIGVVSGAALKGIGSLVPHVVGAVKQIWAAVGSTTKTNPS